MGIVLPKEAAQLQAQLLLRWPASMPSLLELPEASIFVADLVDDIVAATPMAVKAEQEQEQARRAQLCPPGGAEVAMEAGRCHRGTAGPLTLSAVGSIGLSADL